MAKSEKYTFEEIYCPHCFVKNDCYACTDRKCKYHLKCQHPPCNYFLVNYVKDDFGFNAGWLCQCRNCGKYFYKSLPDANCKLYWEHKEFFIDIKPKNIEQLRRAERLCEFEKRPTKQKESEFFRYLGLSEKFIKFWEK